MTAEKRKRSVNFSEDEKMRFLRIMQKKGQVIITKVASHDLQTNRLKEDAWTEITNALNASGTSGSVLRTKDNLKKLWQKMKTEAKANSQTCATGGGPSKKLDDPITEMVADLTGYGSAVPEVTYTGIESAYDCNAEILCIKQEKPNLKRRWPTVTVEEPPNKPKKVSIDNNVANERLKFEKEKSALIELQKQYMAEEHALKIKQADLSIKHADLKTKILETVLMKVQDEKPVDAELLKIVSNM